MVVLINPKNWPRGSSRSTGLFACALIRRKGHRVAQTPLDSSALFGTRRDPVSQPAIHSSLPHSLRDLDMILDRTLS